MQTKHLYTKTKINDSLFKSSTFSSRGPSLIPAAELNGSQGPITLSQSILCPGPHEQLHACSHAHTYFSARAHTYSCAHAHTYSYAHTHTYSHAHAHTYSCAHIPVIKLGSFLSMEHAHGFQAETKPVEEESASLGKLTQFLSFFFTH